MIVEKQSSYISSLFLLVEMRKMPFELWPAFSLTIRFCRLITLDCFGRQQKKKKLIRQSDQINICFSQEIISANLVVNWREIILLVVLLQKDWAQARTERTVQSESVRFRLIHSPITSVRMISRQSIAFLACFECGFR